jgi:hypothetical protein
MHLPEVEIPHHKSDGSSKARRRSIVDRIVSGSAMFVALSSLAIALYEVRMMRAHDRISVWPYVAVGNSDADGVYFYNVRNAGIGPALIRSFELVVDGKPQKNWGGAIDAFGIDMHGAPSSYSHIGKGVVLLPGANLRVLEIGGAAGQALHRAAQTRMHTRICYRSLYEQCWVDDISESTEPQPVDSCADPATPFTQ